MDMRKKNVLKCENMILIKKKCYRNAYKYTFYLCTHCCLIYEFNYFYLFDYLKEKTK